MFAYQLFWNLINAYQELNLFIFRYIYGVSYIIMWLELLWQDVVNISILKMYALIGSTKKSNDILISKNSKWSSSLTAPPLKWDLNLICLLCVPAGFYCLILHWKWLTQVVQVIKVQVQEHVQVQVQVEVQKITACSVSQASNVRSLIGNEIVCTAWESFQRVLQQASVLIQMLNNRASKRRVRGWWRWRWWWSRWWCWSWFFFEKLGGLTDAQNVSGLMFAFLPIEGAQVGAWIEVVFVR